MRLGIAFLALGSLIILVPGLLGMVSAASLVGGAAVYFIGSGILYPTATSCAIEPFPGQAGTAGAILGGMQNLGAGVVTLLAASFPMEGRSPWGPSLTLMVLIVALSFSGCRHCAPENRWPSDTARRARPVGGLFTALLPGGRTPRAVEEGPEQKKKPVAMDGL